ncbi:lipopolysaccharide biosynthesis glycosyltransferase [Stella humosa]|uniref:Lipopolysaccharide biosynthesis glycosyltransferase n=1 Tax=Stella humosa TaxID=94 RepID=A0A3N1LJG3_9PROT|nr:hypothetical protein [Stella humosa]ROP90556.1 lipopolysaccharide biosynthesis glycosyltransferase [Stella humosa]BBK29549.1 hypothetical protein STHU_01830 [Stella humosa]
MTTSAAPAPAGPRRIIVSGADARYFPLLRGLLRSLQAHGLTAGTAFGVLDAGLLPAQRQWLAAAGAIVVDAIWGFDFPLAREIEAARPGIKVMTSRPLLPTLFPGFDTILWLDADTWVQTPDAVELLFRTAEGGTLAAVMEFDRSYAELRQGRPYWDRLHGWYEGLVGAAIAQRMMCRPTINTGVLALRADAPHWARWSRILQNWYRRQKVGSPAIFLLEQFALNGVVHVDGLAFTPLPTRCNWLCHMAVPAWDPDAGLLCDPLPPHDRLGIVHVCDWTKLDALTIPGCDGTSRRLWLTFPPRPAEPPIPVDPPAAGV